MVFLVEKHRLTASDYAEVCLRRKRVVKDCSYDRKRVSVLIGYLEKDFALPTALLVTLMLAFSYWINGWS